MKRSGGVGSGNRPSLSFLAHLYQLEREDVSESNSEITSIRGHWHLGVRGLPRDTQSRLDVTVQTPSQDISCHMLAVSSKHSLGKARPLGKVNMDLVGAAKHWR